MLNPHRSVPTWRRHGLERSPSLSPRPYVHLNFALGADGASCDARGRALNISCAQDWQRVHALRERYDAIAVGARTWINDRPRLTARAEHLGRAPLRQPLRVVFGGNTPLVIEASGRTTFLVGECSLAGVTQVETRGHELGPALACLAEHGLRSMLVEGGLTLASSFITQGVVDELTVYVGTRDPLLAIERARAQFGEVPEWRTVQRLGAGILLVAQPALGGPQ